MARERRRLRRDGQGRAVPDVLGRAMFMRGEDGSGGQQPL